MTKKKAKDYKKRQDRQFLKGRTYRDYIEYISQHLDVFITQRDTVYNDGTGGSFIQTFQFVGTSLQFAIYQQERTSRCMLQGVSRLETLLEKELFRKYVPVLLADRGSEFSAAEAMEIDSEGTRRTRVFYCDPMQSGQKGSLENHHSLLRYLLPKETDLRALGLTDQSALNLVLSHVNSFPVEKLGGKSPLELTEFLYYDLYERLTQFGIQKIEKGAVKKLP